MGAGGLAAWNWTPYAVESSASFPVDDMDSRTQVASAGAGIGVGAGARAAPPPPEGSSLTSSDGASFLAKTPPPPVRGDFVALTLLGALELLDGLPASHNRYVGLAAGSWGLVVDVTESMVQERKSPWRMVPSTVVHVLWCTQEYTQFVWQLCHPATGEEPGMPAVVVNSDADMEPRVVSPRLPQSSALMCQVRPRAAPLSYRSA